jgi:hypothetical protein
MFAVIVIVVFERLKTEREGVFLNGYRSRDLVVNS